MKHLKKLAVMASMVLLGASARAADPADLDALQTALIGKFDTLETIVITGFVIGSAIVVGMLTLHWVDRGGKAKVK